MENTPVKILFIEDNAAFARVLGLIFEDDMRYVWNIKHAKSFPEGVEYLNHESFDVVITDLSFSGIQRSEIIKVLKSVNAVIPIIVLSAYPDKRLIEKVLEQGAHKFFDKEEVLSEHFINSICDIVNESSKQNAF